MDTLSRSPEYHDLTKFTILDITECGRVLRQMGNGAESMEEVAGRIVRYLYDTLADKQSGTKVCALVRFFKTLDYQALAEELKVFVKERPGGAAPLPGMKCMTLLGTAGEEPAWNSRRSSQQHKVFPLPGEETFTQIPMLLNLVRQLGLPLDMVVNPDPELLLDMEQRNYNVFYIAEALGSPYIPAQEQFVVPYGIRSVVGFGGLLPSGDMFAIVMFLKVPLKREAADLFRTLSLNVKLAILPFEGRVFP